MSQGTQGQSSDRSMMWFRVTYRLGEIRLDGAPVCWRSTGSGNRPSASNRSHLGSHTRLHVSLQRLSLTTSTPTSNNYFLAWVTAFQLPLAPEVTRKVP